MSPHAANSLVHDLVQMAQAMERLPTVERELEHTNLMMQEQGKVIVSMQADLEQSRTYAATLEQKVHDAEVARDDAELSFLEADERTSRALDFVKALFGNAGALIQALEPPKAAPQADSPSTGLSVPQGEPVGTSTVSHGDVGQATASGHMSGDAPIAAQLDSHPVGEHSAAPSSAYASDWTISPGEAAPTGERESPLAGEHAPSQEWSASANVDTAPNSVGQREPGPTATSASPQADHALTMMDTAAVTEEPAALGPYHGKNYYDHPVYVSYLNWIAGGGTEWDYYNRRERSSVL